MINHTQEALARLIEQYKNKPKLATLLSTLIVEVQNLEVALTDLLLYRYIDTGVGAQLDVVGRIVGERRDGSTDVDYRLRLRATVRASRSSGTVEDLLGVFAALLGASTHARLYDMFPAGFVLDVLSPTVTISQVPILQRFLKRSRLGAVYAAFVYSESDEANTFSMPLAAFLTIGVSGVPTRIFVSDTSAFASSGTLRIGLDTGASERVFSYATKTPTSFDGITGWVGASVFPIGELVVEANDPLRGFGDDTNPLTGGTFAGAALS